MKKFKIKGAEIFANSLHDALEIYKHKVKDRSSFKQLATTLSRIAYAFPDWPYFYFKTDEDRKIAKNYLDKKGIKYEEINNKNGRYLDLSYEYGRPIYGHDSKVKDFNAILDPFLIKKLQRAIDTIKSSDYKEAKSLVDDVSGDLKYRV